MVPVPGDSRCGHLRQTATKGRMNHPAWQDDLGPPGRMTWTFMGTYGSILSPYGSTWAHVGPILAYQGEEKKHILPSRMIILPPGHHPASNNKLPVARFWALYVMASSLSVLGFSVSGSGFLLVSSAGSKKIGHVKVQQVSTAGFTRNRDNRRISQRDNKHNCILFFSWFLGSKDWNMDPCGSV